MHASAPLPEDATVRHVIDASQSSFAVQVTATGLLSAFGHNPKIVIRDFAGNIEFMVGASPLANIVAANEAAWARAGLAAVELHSSTIRASAAVEAR